MVNKLKEYSSIKGTLSRRNFFIRSVVILIIIIPGTLIAQEIAFSLADLFVITPAENPSMSEAERQYSLDEMNKYVFRFQSLLQIFLLWFPLYCLLATFVKRTNDLGWHPIIGAIPGLTIILDGLVTLPNTLYSVLLLPIIPLLFLKSFSNSSDKEEE